MPAQGDIGTADEEEIHRLLQFQQEQEEHPHDDAHQSNADDDINIRELAQQQQIALDGINAIVNNQQNLQQTLAANRNLLRWHQLDRLESNNDNNNDITATTANVPQRQQMMQLQLQQQQARRPNATVANSNTNRRNRLDHFYDHPGGMKLYFLLSALIAILAVITSPSNFLFNTHVGVASYRDDVTAATTIATARGDYNKQSVEMVHNNAVMHAIQNAMSAQKGRSDFFVEGGDGRELVDVDVKSDGSLEGKQGGGWEAVVAHQLSKSSTARLKNNDVPSPPKDTSSTGSYWLEDMTKDAWNNIREHYKEQYSVLQRIRAQSPSLRSVDSSDNEGRATVGHSFSRFFSPWQWGQPDQEHIHRDEEFGMRREKSITVMNTSGRFKSMSGNNSEVHPVFSFLSRLIDPSLTRPLFSSKDGNDATDEGRVGDENGERTASSMDYSAITDVVDKILTSTPRLLAIANLLLALTYLLHTAVADIFLGTVGTTRNAANPAPATGTRRGATGPVDQGGAVNTNNADANRATLVLEEQTRRQRRIGRERLGGYLLFKLLLVSAVVEPDTLDLLILLSWYTLLSFLRSLGHVAGSTIHQAAQSGQPPRQGALRLLLLVLLCNTCAALGCVLLFHDSGWNMLLLLTCDCVLLAADVFAHLSRHVAAIIEDRHRRRIAELEERQAKLHMMRREMASDYIVAASDDDEEFVPFEVESRQVVREVEAMEAKHSRRLAVLDKAVFSLELFALFLTAIHFVHIWALHGASFGLVDGILALHLHSTLSSAGRKVSSLA